MAAPPDPHDAAPPYVVVAPSDAALQHRPRPLPLFLALLRSETAGDPERATAALAGLAAYQQAPRHARPREMPTVAQVGRARLLDHGGAGRPVVVVPSLINGPEVLDLLPERSLVRWLAGQGFNPLLVDWGTPDPRERALSIGGHVETLLLPLLRSIGIDHAMIGYCLGGTIALAAAALRRPAALALIAAPWRFDGFPGEARDDLASLWSRARPTAEAIGLLPLEVLQAGFWQLDPRRLIDKFAAFGHRVDDPEATRVFVALEDWANDGPPLTCAAGAELFDDLFGHDLTGRGVWQVGGHVVDPGALSCPVLDIVSSTDRIVPIASSVGIGRRITLAQGHVGMIVGSRAQAVLWEPLARWLRDPDLV